MKWVFRRKPARQLTHEEAKGCFAANLVLPGTGSLAAGRSVGYVQLVVTVAATIITIAGTVATARWYLTTGGPNPNGDPMFNLVDLWRHFRWPLFGVGVFLFSLFWGMITGWQILAESPKDRVPPRIA